MFVRIVDHWCNPGQVENGSKHIDRVGNAAATAPGFLFRFRMESREDPTQLTTLTVWVDRNAFEAFQNLPPLPSNPDAANFFARTRDQVFDVASTLGALSAVRVA